MISSMLEPASRFSNTVDTGILVSRNTHAPLRLPGMLSTAGHWDQSRLGMFSPAFIVACSAGFCHGSVRGVDAARTPTHIRKKRECVGHPVELLVAWNPSVQEVKIPALSQKTRQGRATLGSERWERVGQPPC